MFVYIWLSVVIKANALLLRVVYNSLIYSGILRNQISPYTCMLYMHLSLIFCCFQQVSNMHSSLLSYLHLDLSDSI